MGMGYDLDAVQTLDGLSRFKRRRLLAVFVEYAKGMCDDLDDFIYDVVDCYNLNSGFMRWYRLLMLPGKHINGMGDFEDVYDYIHDGVFSVYIALWWLKRRLLLVLFTALSDYSCAKVLGDDLDDSICEVRCERYFVDPTRLTQQTAVTPTVHPINKTPDLSLEEPSVHHCI